MGLRLLVVEGDHQVLSILVTLCADRGYDVSAASTAHEAIEQLAATRPKLVLLDLHMPHGASRDLLARITRDPVGPPVIVTSVYADERTHTFCRSCGVADFLHKPFDVDELFRRVDAVAGLVR